MPSKVSLVKNTDSYEGTLASLIQIEDDILKGLQGASEVVIKINFVTTVRKLATTPVSTVHAILEFLKDRYKGDVLIVETAAMGSTRLGYSILGFNGLIKRYKARLLDLEDDQTETIFLDGENGTKVKVPYSKTLKSGSYVISATRPKTHDTVVVTLSLKNLAVGGIVGPRYLVHNGNIHKNLLELAKIRQPDLAVLDGTVGMEGRGPTFGTPIRSNWVLASTDFLAADSLATYLMGFDLKNVGYLYLCRKENLGNAYPDNIQIIGENPKKLRMHYKPHPTYKKQINWR